MGVGEVGRHIINRLEFPQSFHQKQVKPENKRIFAILKEKKFYQTKKSWPLWKYLLKMKIKSFLTYKSWEVCLFLYFGVFLFVLQHNCLIRNTQGNSSGRREIVSDKNSNPFKEMKKARNGEYAFFFSFFFCSNVSKR